MGQLLDGLVLVIVRVLHLGRGARRDDGPCLGSAVVRWGVRSEVVLAILSGICQTTRRLIMSQLVEQFYSSTGSL